MYATGLWLTVAFFLWACTPAQTTPQPTRTPSLFATLSGPVAEATLPPTWTPTFTPSPLPPTATETAVPTFTPAPTLTAAEICTGFVLFYEIPDRKVFRWDRVIPFAFDITAEDVKVQFVATHRRTGQNQGLELVGGETYLFEFPVNFLPVSGVYDWHLSVISDQYGELCPHSGTFIALNLPSPATSTPTPSITPTEAEN